MEFDAERQIAEQMAHMLRTRIKEIEALKKRGATLKRGGARLALLRDLLADLERGFRSNSHTEFRDWNGWLKRFPCEFEQRPGNHQRKHHELGEENEAN